MNRKIKTLKLPTVKSYKENYKLLLKMVKVNFSLKSQTIAKQLEQLLMKIIKY